MNRYYMIRRLRGPLFLLMLGGMALLNQYDVLGWGKSWPLFLIFFGMMALAERMALNAAQTEQIPGYPAAGYQPQAGSPAGYPAPEQNGIRFAADAGQAPTEPAHETTAIVPTLPAEIVKDPEGGR